jgi:hypothetical protein
MSKAARDVVALLALFACTAETPTSVDRARRLDRSTDHEHDGRRRRHGPSSCPG